MTSIRTVVSTILTVQVFLAVGITSMISFVGTKRATSDLGEKLGEKISLGVEEQTTHFLEQPQALNRIQNSLLLLNKLEIDNFQDMQQLFWQQVKYAGDGTFLYFASTDGRYLGVEKHQDQEVVLKLKDPSTQGKRATYALNAQGQRTEKIDESDREYIVQDRPWYQTAIAAGEVTWTEIFPASDGEALEIHLVMPVTLQGQLEGVLGVKLTLSNISKFLAQEEEPINSFIIDRQGLMVAHHSGRDFVLGLDARNHLQQISGLESADPVAQTVVSHLTESGTLNTLTENQVFHLAIADGGKKENFLVVADPLQDFEQLNWIVITAIPHRYVFQNVYRTYWRTLWGSLVILMVAGTASLLTARWLVTPILRLNQAAKDLSNDNFDPQQITDLTQRSEEVGEFARVFNDMALTIHHREESLAAQMQSLKQDMKTVQGGSGGQHNTSPQWQRVLLRARHLRQALDGQTPPKS